MKPIAFPFFLLLLAPALEAQSTAALLTKGDQAVAARNASDALKAYEEALAIDSTNVVVLHKATKVVVSMTEFMTDKAQQKALADKGERYARRAFTRDSTSAEAHFVMAQAIGRTAQIGGPMVGLKYGPVIYAHGRSCLAIQPNHAGCLHVVGAWHAEITRRGEFAMKIAAAMSKNPVYTTANQDTAQVYLERAVAAEPGRIIHRLALGRVYVDRNLSDKARAQFLAVQQASLVDFNDAEYKKQATAALEKLKTS